MQRTINEPRTSSSRRRSKTWPRRATAKQGQQPCRTTRWTQLEGHFSATFAISPLPPRTSPISSHALTPPPPSEPAFAAAISSSPSPPPSPLLSLRSSAATPVVGLCCRRCRRAPPPAPRSPPAAHGATSAVSMLTRPLPSLTAHAREHTTPLHSTVTSPPLASATTGHIGAATSTTRLRGASHDETRTACVDAGHGDDSRTPSNSHATHDRLRARMPDRPRRRTAPLARRSLLPSTPPSRSSVFLCRRTCVSLHHNERTYSATNEYCIHTMLQTGLDFRLEGARLRRLCSQVADSFFRLIFSV